MSDVLTGQAKRQKCDLLLFQVPVGSYLVRSYRNRSPLCCCCESGLVSLTFTDCCIAVVRFTDKREDKASPKRWLHCRSLSPCVGHASRQGGNWRLILKLLCYLSRCTRPDNRYSNTPTRYGSTNADSCTYLVYINTESCVPGIMYQVLLYITAAAVLETTQSGFC